MEKQFYKKFLQIAIMVISSAVVVIFTVLCMANFEKGFLQKYAPVITSVAVCLEIVYISSMSVFYLKKFETVYKFMLTGIVLAAVLLLALFLFQITGLWNKIDTMEKLRKLIDSTGVWAPIVFIVLQALQVFLLPLPGVLTVGAGVAMFGEFETCIYSYIGILAGSMFAFFIGRVAGYKVAAWLVGEESLEKWLNKVKGKDRMLLTAMFVLPMFPDDILCFVSGLSTMSWKYFIIMQLFARALSVVATSYSLGGNIIPYTTWWGILIWVLFGIAIIVFFIFLYKKGDKIERWFINLFKRDKNKMEYPRSEEKKSEGAEPKEEHSQKTKADTLHAEVPLSDSKNKKSKNSESVQTEKGCKS